MPSGLGESHATSEAAEAPPHSFLPIDQRLALRPELTSRGQKRKAADNGDDKNREDPLARVLHTLPILPSPDVERV